MPSSVQRITVLIALALAAGSGVSCGDSGGTGGSAGSFNQGGSMAGSTGTGGFAGTATGGSSGNGGAATGGGSPGSGGSSNPLVDASPTGDARAEGSPAEAGTGGSARTDAAARDMDGTARDVGAVARSDAGAPSEGGTYQPCPTDGSACKVLPLGDSITFGIQFEGAYRVELFSRAVMAGRKITFTGSQMNGPTTVAGMPFPRSHEGHSGWTIDQVAGLIPSPALATIPDIVLLHIGTNDVFAANTNMMATRLGALIDKITNAAPRALLVVAKIIPLGNGNGAATIQAFNDAIPGLVQTRVAAGKHVIAVDMNTNFTPQLLSSDGVHPNQSGYNFMGDVWYAAIGPLLP